jgi:hypothetical protein
MKKCNVCHQEFPIIEYHKGSAKCKVCQRKASKDLAKAKKRSCAVFSTKKFEL